MGARAKSLSVRTTTLYADFSVDSPRCYMKPAFNSFRVPNTQNGVPHDLGEIPVKGYEED
jgi:hypothetical protein